jgi:hypothetical protein
MNTRARSAPRWLNVCSVLVGLLFVSPALVGESRGGEKPKATPAAKLVDAIVNRNKAPKIVDWKAGIMSTAALFHKVHDWKEEARVGEALRRLGKDKTEEVWEELVKRAGDRRYCETATSGVTGDAEVRTVGDVCSWLAYSRLVGVYWQHVPSSWSFDGRAPWVRLSLGAVAQWRKRRADKPLYHLQIEVCEMALEVIKALPKRKLDMIPRGERERVVRKIEAEIASLKKTKRPVHVRGDWNFLERGIYDEKLAAKVREGVRTGKYDPALIYK